MIQLQDNQHSRSVVHTNYYRINGQRSTRPHRGLYIRQDIYSHGKPDMQKKISDKTSKFLLHATNKEPMVMCEILDIDNLDLFDPH